MKKSTTYPSIDMVQTGKKLKSYMEQAGMSVKDVQLYLHLSCPQPIYRWFKGKILPSVDHLLSLSELFGVHMEELLVKKQDSVKLIVYIYDDSKYQKRMSRYFEMLMESTA